MDFTIDVIETMPSNAALAQGGCLFQAAAVLTATAIANANFALVNKLGNGLPIWLLSARVQATAAMEVDLFRVNADPALTANTQVQNCQLGGKNAGATFEAQVVATPGNNGQFGAVEANADEPSELLPAGVLYIPSGYGVMIASALVAGNVALTLVWAEIDAAFSDYLAERE